MNILVGDTGFVGSNLCANMVFDKTYNSKNVEEAFGSKPNMLIYAGVKGTKFLANKFPNEDKQNILNAINNIRLINPKKIVLISTVDVYDNLNQKNEDYVIDSTKLHTYGKNRYELEKWVINNINDYHILRLPAIYGLNLKKNFIHDLIFPAPAYLTMSNYKILVQEKHSLENYYNLIGNMYVLKENNEEINDFFRENDYNSVLFTDSESQYQYLNLNTLSNIIDEVLKKNIKILNCVTEPIESKYLYKKIYKKDFYNIISDMPIRYEILTKYKLDSFNNSKGYLIKKEEVLKDLIDFINRGRKIYE